MNMKIAVFGSYSGNNKGDLAIITSIVKNLLNNEKSITLFIPSKNPEALKAVLPKFEGNLVKVFKTITANWGISTLKIIKNTDLLIFGGGGLFFDQKLYNVFYNHVINLFFIILANKIFFKKPVYIFSVGASNLKSSATLFMTKVILRNTSYVTVRDENTYNIFSKCYKGKVNIYFDPAFLLESAEKSNTHINNLLKKINGNRKILFVINEAILNKAKKSFKINELVNVINRLQNQYLVVLSYNMAKSKQVDTFYNLCKKDNLVLFHPHEAIPEDMIYFNSKFDYTICAPMHAAIFAYNAGTKIITIEYDDKVIAFNKITGNKNNVKIDNMAKIHWLLDNYYEIDWDRKNIIKENALNNFIKLKEAINDIKANKK